MWRKNGGTETKIMQFDLTLTDSDLRLTIAAFCASAGNVKSVKVHRQAKPFALVEMSSDSEALELAAIYGRPPVGRCVLVHLKTGTTPA
jgi:hypothetical protein